jgi:hypothetical protein
LRPISVHNPNRIVKKASAYNRLGDTAGLWGSVICLLHCLAVPVASILPALGGMATINLHIHFLDYIFIALATLAVWLALRHTRSTWIVVIMLLGLVLFAGGTLLHERWPWMLIPASIGSLLLILAHASNLRQRWQQRSCTTNATA